MYKNKYLKIFTNCILTKGYNRSLILDLQRENFIAIPATMLDVIKLFLNKNSIEKVIELYGEENKDTIAEYIAFLLENDFAFIAESNEFDLFIEMDLTFELPYNVTNCIIELSEKNLQNLNKIVNALEKLNCRYVQFVSYESLDPEDLKFILELTNNTNFKSIELMLKYTYNFVAIINEIEKNNGRVTELIFHSAKEKKKLINKTNLLIDFIDYEIKNFKNCGKIESKYFNINKNKVLESLNHNTCLNRKISIDKDGNIKNCPSMAESFGNIKDTTLEEALNKPGFKKYWNINKDQIEVCKDCEFRHICTDCRAYIEDPENQYSKPLKCGYNPYTNVWEEWSTNPLKQKAIEYYGMQDLVKKDL